MRRIALDGPAGSGKSTVAKIIARKLGIEYLDTGAMYRAVTLFMVNNKVSLTDANAIEQALKEIHIDFVSGRLYLNHEDVSEEIRTPEIAAKVSEVAAVKAIRVAMVKQQQDMACRKEIVMDGRDIGTVVLPHTPYKFYLTASIEERALRRYDEMKLKGLAVELHQIQEDIAKRDAFDMNREESPLMQAEGAILIDTTGMDIDGVVNCLLQHIERISE